MHNHPTDIHLWLVQSYGKWTRCSHCVCWLSESIWLCPTWHEPLISKLHHTGLHPHVVKWVQCYLTNRSQRVVVNDSESDVVKVISGVPQGSVLSPLLFLVYVNDLCNISFSHGSKVTMHADNLYKVIDTESAFFCLQEYINNIVQWTRSNLMTLNYSKCILPCRYHSLLPLFLESKTFNRYLLTSISVWC